jgi:hypothetical protein
MATKQKILALELSDRRKSGWIMEGTQGTYNEECLDAPNIYFLPLESVTIMKEDVPGFPAGSYRPIRHIEGCNTIYKDEQEKLNIKPNHDRDVIIFSKGVCLVPDQGRDKSRYAYLQACEYNANNKDRPETAVPVFRVIEKEVEAVKSLVNMDNKLEAYRLLSTLREKMDSGYSYNNERIDFMCSLFGVSGVESYAEKLEQLQWRAEADPTKFVDSVLNKRSEVKVTILEAEKFNVIALTGDFATLVDGGRQFYKFSSNKKPAKMEELVDYFLLPKGQDDCNQMNIRLEKAKLKEVSLV